MSPQRYKVEHNFTYGWDDAGWTVNGRAQRFASVAKAEQAIKELVSDVRAAVKRGDMDTLYKAEDFRVVSVKP